MYDPDDQDEDGDEVEFPSIKADPIDFLIVGVATAQAVMETFAKALDKVVYLLVAHANHMYDTRRSVNDFRLELESLPTTEE
jgi:hypothetical protein